MNLKSPKIQTGLILEGVKLRQELKSLRNEEEYQGKPITMEIVGYGICNMGWFFYKTRNKHTDLRRKLERGGEGWRGKGRKAGSKKDFSITRIQWITQNCIWFFRIILFKDSYTQTWIKHYILCKGTFCQNEILSPFPTSNYIKMPNNLLLLVL